MVDIFTKNICTVKMCSVSTTTDVDIGESILIRHLLNCEETSVVDILLILKPMKDNIVANDVLISGNGVWQS